MEKVVVAIIGGGPRSVYALERLLALLTTSPPAFPISIHIFDNTGRFGAGMAHSDLQSKSCYLNRPVNQIAFAADESVSATDTLLPAYLRLNFYHWCRQRFYETGNKQFDLQPHDMPHRYLHGLALREYFDAYSEALRELPNVDVATHSDDVTRVSRDDKAFVLHSTGFPTGFRFHYALFVTGHTPCRAHWKTAEARFHRGLRYIPYAYPLERVDIVYPGSRVALSGMGLTAIDICLHLTEGRGGHFVNAADGGLHYHPCGAEPAQIIAFSRSGQIYSARPRNEKNAADAHQARFFCPDAIDILRRYRGVTSVQRDGRICRQLDFQRDVFPLIVLEMAWVYYRTLLGDRFVQEASTTLIVHYQDFLTRPSRGVQCDIDILLSTLTQRFHQMAQALTTACPVTTRTTPAIEEAAVAFLRTLTDETVAPGDAIRRLRSLPPEAIKWRHPPDINDHLFDWEEIFHPTTQPGRSHKAAILEALERDLAYAEQGNLSNPMKAACDGVWRDLRAVFSSVTDFGGLTPDSHRDFMQHWLSHYNRLSNGAGIEAMEKLGTLIREGRVMIAPAVTRIRSSGKRQGYRLVGRKFHQQVDYLCCARLHPFDARRQHNPLYPSMLTAGLVRLWENRGASGESFIPGALDLTSDFHPIDCDNRVERRLTFLGAPVEGLCFFQNSAARPDSNSTILTAVHGWATELIEWMTQFSQTAQEIESL
ncbi:FAD/NAD(P)-binding protein [Dickeya poaceiphila]|uniref:FAD-dependent urate hydroxylase HpyO/Asp monooxygenase CreE-like FAD/NAD(P)-binding domain-containing protein n=1 Tax=Dickeya poaceiphila TaxID=568768 RepID=A0A5B8I7M0_9GAMM|nr:FAD/NAD(P)-binding protein [Dickeya poaceiphila]QDX29060.1 hypothetical protein Dpoa569_0000767 [Dickeya poaceiphila]